MREVDLGDEDMPFYVSAQESTFKEAKEKAAQMNGFLSMLIRIKILPMSPLIEQRQILYK